MNPARAALAIIATVLLSACTETPQESLLGCFTTEAKGKLAFKVTEDDDQYALSVPRDGSWVSAQAMRPGTTALLKSVLGPDNGKAMASLVSENEQIMLIRVDPETIIAGGTAESGYIGSFFFGTGQIYRAESCELT